MRIFFTRVQSKLIERLFHTIRPFPHLEWASGPPTHTKQPPVLSKLRATQIQPELSTPQNTEISTSQPYHMESDEDIELIKQAIQKLIEERRIKDTSGVKLSEDDDEQLLSILLSQLESLKGDSAIKQSEGSTLVEEITSRRVEKAESKSENGSQVESGSGEIGVEEIVKELKAVKKQNTITHRLLSVMIVVTVFWQLSEVSLFLKVKNGLSHPFRSLGSMLVGMLPRPGVNNGHDTEKNRHNQSPVKIPDLPHVELPHLGSSSDGH